ncbi:MAG: nuclear transport factor 2 family protein [Acidobacteriota bacterium]|nr:nuclear transport factor 2 family protein [Acidobacteriota bacterium]
MADTPLQAVLRALDALDLERTLALFAPDGSLTTIFGDAAAGRDAVHDVLAELLGDLRATHHEVTSQWNPEQGLWIAEMSASYVLSDHSRRGPYERVMLVRAGDAGIEQMRIYGAHERPLAESEHPYTEVRGAHGWLPTL